MTPDAVAAYLKQHPEFFEQHADMLADVAIPHPHGGRAISISERQILTLREKSRQLEAKLHELLQFGEENDVLSAKVQRLAVALVAAPDRESAVQATLAALREDFDLPHAVLRLFGDGTADAERQFAVSLAQPYCSSLAVLDSAGWFDAPDLRSYAYVALRGGGEVFGLLALGSEDPQRFYPEMGTLYLERVGDLISAALTRNA